MLSPAEMDKKTDQHFGFAACDDVEGVLATLAPDAEHDIVGLASGPTCGREGARAFYVDTVRRLYGDNVWFDYPAIVRQLTED